MNLIHPNLIIKETPTKGKGVFALNAIEANTLIEVSPVIVLNAEDTKIIHKTHLHDYYFIWGENQDKSAIALGYISIYNHAKTANCKHECDFENNTISIYTKVFISSDEELCINYNKGEDKALWFSVE